MLPSKAPPSKVVFSHRGSVYVHFDFHLVAPSTFTIQLLPCGGHVDLQNMLIQAALGHGVRWNDLALYGDQQSVRNGDV